MRTVFHPLVAVMLLLPASAAHAQIEMDGHGPDAWQVTGVAADDTLNVRAGPGTKQLVIGAFAHDATGLQMITCLPFTPRETYRQLTESQREGLPSRCCLMEGRGVRPMEWVSARYLAEDTSAATQPVADPLIADAVVLVRRAYEYRLSAARQGTAGPLVPSVARDYFFPDVVARLRQGPLSADPFFGAQETQITDLAVFPAPDDAMFRGRITVHASFRNFRQPRLAVVRLRIDTSLADPALRIMRIEHGE